MGSGKSKLKAYANPIDQEKFLGKWYVNAVIPTPFEKNIFNPTETYIAKPGKKNMVDVLFQFNKGSLTGKESELKQFLYLNDKDGNWSISPTFLKVLKLSYTILDIGGKYMEGETERYDYVVVAHKNKYAWIMSRSSKMQDTQMEESKALLTDNGFRNLEKRLIYPKHESS